MIKSPPIPPILANWWINHSFKIMWKYLVYIHHRVSFLICGYPFQSDKRQKNIFEVATRNRFRPKFRYTLDGSQTSKPQLCCNTTPDHCQEGIRLTILIRILKNGRQAGPPKGPPSSKFLKSQNRFLQAASNVNVLICKLQKLNKHELNFLRA